MTTEVRDARPPAAVIRVLNPIMRTVLPTPLGRLVKPFALLEFSGRRSGRRYRVPAGWHQTGGGPVVITPAAWRVNFADGTRASVRYRGHRLQMTGTLVTDPATVAETLQSMFDSGASPRNLGINMAEEHRITASDVASLDRAMIRFRFVEDETPAQTPIPSPGSTHPPG